MKKIQFNVDDVMPRLAQVVRLVNARHTMPILADVLLETKRGAEGVTYLMLTASDNETWLSMKAPLMDGEEGVALCVNAADFNTAVANLRSLNLVMTIDEEHHSLTCDYGNGHFQLPYEDATVFPRAEVPAAEDTTNMMLDGARLATLIERTNFATSTDDLRPLLTGVRFDFSDNGTVSAASDAHKLARYLDKTVKTDTGVKMGFTLPKKPSTFLTAILANYEGSVRVAFNQRNAVFNNKEFRLVTRLIDGRYPNYEAIIPYDNDIKADIDKDAILTALKRTLLMANNTSELVSLTFMDRQVILTAVDDDMGKAASESVECDYDGGQLTIGFNGTNLGLVLRSINCERVRLMMKGSASACIMRPVEDEDGSEYLAIVMPMKIS